MTASVRLLDFQHGVTCSWQYFWLVRFFFFILFSEYEICPQSHSMQLNWQQQQKTCVLKCAILYKIMLNIWWWKLRADVCFCSSVLIGSNMSESDISFTWTIYINRKPKSLCGVCLFYHVGYTPHKIHLHCIICCLKQINIIQFYSVL